MSTLRLCTAAAAAAKRGAGVGLSTLSTPVNSPRACYHFANSLQSRASVASRQLRQCRFQSTEAQGKTKKELRLTADWYAPLNLASPPPPPPPPLTGIFLSPFPCPTPSFFLSLLIPKYIATQTWGVTQSMQKSPSKISSTSKPSYHMRPPS